MSGLIASQRTRAGVNDNSTYYILKGQPIDAPVLVNPVKIEATDDTTNATIFVNGASSGAYQGAINIEPGANGVSATPGDGITIRTGAGPSTIVDVGANAQGPNLLLISGASGSSQVNDGIYNPVVKSAPIFEETFALDSTVNNGLKQISFTVPRTGAYMLQININLANADLIPTLPSGLPGGAIEWTTTTTAIPAPNNEVQYLSSTLSGDIFTKASQVGPVAEPMDYVFSSLGFFQTLDVGQNYSFNMYALLPLVGGVPTSRWNINSIKARLIQMC